MIKEELFKVSQAAPAKPKKVLTEAQKEKMKEMRAKSLAIRQEKAKQKKAGQSPQAPPPPQYYQPAPTPAPAPVHTPSPVAAAHVQPKKTVNYEDRFKEAEGHFKNLADQYIQRYLTEHKKAMDERMERFNKKPQPVKVAESAPVKTSSPLHHVSEPVQKPAPVQKAVPVVSEQPAYTRYINNNSARMLSDTGRYVRNRHLGGF
jgi:hypothetical protein